MYGETKKQPELRAALSITTTKLFPILGFCQIASFVVYIFSYVRKIDICFFFLIQRSSQDIMDLIFAENVCQFTKRSVGSDFVVFDLLRSDNKSGITNGSALEFRDHLPPLLNKALHRR